MMGAHHFIIVMAGLVPGMRVLLIRCRRRCGCAGASPRMKAADDVALWDDQQRF
jgi:hypothetical protein